MKQLFIISILLLAACTQQPIGGDKDEHGCMIAAGYSWCEDKQKCIRAWEEPCESAPVTDFDSCVAAGNPVMESYPRQCNANGQTFTEPINLEEQCTINGGTWIDSAHECEGIGKDACQEIGGHFNECASACRNDPTAEICTMQCVQVCQLDIVGGDSDEHGCKASAGYSWCEEKQKCLRTWEEPCTEPEITDFDSCVAAGNPVMESYPRQCNANGQTYTEDIGDMGRCEMQGGTWIEEAAECEGISEQACDSLGGEFNNCASACRNDPDAMACTKQCVLVCQLGKPAEQRAIEAATSYIEATEQYADYDGRGLKFTQVDVLRCPGCFVVHAEYTATSMKNSSREDRITVTATLNNYEVTDYVQAAGSAGMSPSECEAMGGTPVNTVGGATCPEGTDNAGDVVGFISPNICCVGFCGTSTEASCENDSDCTTDGCSGQICRSTSEEPTITTCIYKDCYDDAKYGVSCGCVDGKCRWA